MQQLSLFVTGKEMRNSRQYLIAEPLLTIEEFTGFASDFSGELYAVSSNSVIPLGHHQLLLTLFDGIGGRWQLLDVELPEIPFFLANDPSLRIIFDQIITFTPSKQLLSQLKYSKWKSFAIKIGDHLGVICPVKRKKLGINRMIIVGKYEFKLDCSVQIVDIDDTDEILGDSVQIL